MNGGVTVHLEEERTMLHDDIVGIHVRGALLMHLKAAHLLPAAFVEAVKLVSPDRRPAARVLFVLLHLDPVVSGEPGHV